MTFWGLAWRNAIGNRRRMLVLSAFLTLTTFMLIMAATISNDICTAMRDSFIRGMTGHIQLRHGETREGDIVAMGTSWDRVVPLTAPAVEELLQVSGTIPGITETTVRIRTSGMMISESSQMTVLITGQDLTTARFRASIDLVDGELPGVDQPGIILTEKQAKTLKVAVGDTVGILAETVAGYTSDTGLVVKAIANLKGLSGFGFDVAFVPLESARTISDLPPGAASDVIVHLAAVEDSPRALKDFQDQLGGQSAAGPYTISQWQEMGGFIQGFFIFIQVIFAGLLVFMVIIAMVLIVNLLLMTALDRFRDIGTMRALGFSRAQILQLFIGEILLISLASSLVGSFLATALVLGLGAGGLPAFIQQMEIAFGGKVLYLSFNPVLIPLSLGINVIISLLAAYFPARFASRMDPVKALQST